MFVMAARLGDGLTSLLGRRMPLNSEVIGKLLASECYSPARIWDEAGWRASVPLLQGLRRTLEGS
jgi:hypothetical protein